MSKRRGKRIVVGYVVSHTGKRGGPWEATWGPLGTPTNFPHTMLRYSDADDVDADVEAVRMQHPHARALPLVRYEVDAEEERLRDAVVDAAERWERAVGEPGIRNTSDERFLLLRATRALRAHREKVGR